jgi:hypothetical protein
MWPIELKFASYFDGMVAEREPKPHGPLRLARRLGVAPEVRAAASDATALGERLNRYVDWEFGNLDRIYLPALAEPLVPARRPAGPYFEESRGYRLGEALRIFLGATWDAYGGRDDPPVLGFKTIEVEHQRRYEEALAPRLKVVHVVRDPLTQFESTKRTVVDRNRPLFHYPVGDLVTTFLRRYVRHAHNALEGTARAPDRHLVVRYEDVCTGPREQVARVCEWAGIGLPPDPELQTVLGRRATELPDAPSGAERAPVEVVSNMATAFGYRPVVSERERALVASVTGPFARRLGYDYAGDELSATERVRLAAAWVPPERWELAVIGRRTGVRSFVRRRALVLQTALRR